MKANLITGFTSKPKAGANAVARDVKIAGFRFNLKWADDDGGFQHFMVWIDLPWIKKTVKLVHLILDSHYFKRGIVLVGVEWFGYDKHCDDFIRFNPEEYGDPLLTRDGMDFIYE